MANSRMVCWMTRDELINLTRCDTPIRRGLEKSGSRSPIGKRIFLYGTTKNLNEPPKTPFGTSSEDVLKPKMAIEIGIKGDF